MLKAENKNQPKYTTKLIAERVKEAEPPDPLIIKFQVVELPWIKPGYTSLVMEGDFPPSRPPYEESEQKGGKQGGKEGGLNKGDRRAVRRAVEEGGSGIQTKDLMELLNCTRTPAQNRLNALVNGGFLKREGESRGTRYVATEAGKKAAKK